MYSESFGSSDEPSATNTAVSTEVHVEGQLDAGDLLIPRLTIAQKLSEDRGTPGQVGINLGERVVICYNRDVKVPANILSARKYWKQDIKFGTSQDYPKIANTAAEAKLLEEEGPYPVIHVADFVLLIALTGDCLLDEDDALEAFPFEVGENRFAMVKLTAQKRGYDSTFKRVTTFQLTNKGVDLSQLIWNFAAQNTKNSYGSWDIPTLAATRDKVSPEVAAFIAELKGGAQ
jgi:hypothetical protein